MKLSTPCCDTARVALTADKSIRKCSPDTQIVRGQKQCAFSAQPRQRRDEFALGPITALLNYYFLLVLFVLIGSQGVLERTNDVTCASHCTSGTAALRRPISAVYAPWTARLRPKGMEVAITKRSSENLGGLVEIRYTVDFGDQSIAPAGAQDLLPATKLTSLSGEVYAVLGQYTDEHLSPWRAKVMTGRYN
ncbi:hypothetical protein N7536_007495 [Penicillium majusculum]|nr:hypothetical protein N7536_007495 [Penicillium majusculum]